MQDKADLVVMARAQLADPEFCNKAKAGKLNSIKYCIGCDQGCYDYFCRCLEDPSLEHITCLRNPAVLEEETMALRPAPQAKKVLIAGGGICRCPIQARTSSNPLRSRRHSGRTICAGRCRAPERRFPTGGVHGGRKHP